MWKIWRLHKRSLTFTYFLLIFLTKSCENTPVGTGRAGVANFRTALVWIVVGAFPPVDFRAVCLSRAMLFFYQISFYACDWSTFWLRMKAFLIFKSFLTPIPNIPMTQWLQGRWRTNIFSQNNTKVRKIFNVHIY